MTSLPSQPASPSIYGLRVTGRDEAFSVSSFRAREEVDRLYRADVQVTLDAGDESLVPALVDAGATLTILDGGHPVRALHGIVARVAAHGIFLRDRQALVLTIVPALWRLKRRRTRRIFQELTTLQIASQVLGEWDVPSRFEVARPLPVRGYCVQYDETDQAFLARLFAEEGLFFHFDHPLAGPRETLVVADAGGGYAPIHGGERLAFERMPEAGALRAREDHVTWFVPRERVRSTRALVRGHDFRHPGADLRDESVSHAATAEARVVYEHEGSYEDDLPGRGPLPGPLAELESLPGPLPGLGPLSGVRPSSARLEQERRKAVVADGVSFCRRLCPGRRFALHGHELARLDRAYVVTRVEHEGYAAEVAPQGKALYQNRFRCLPADAAVRPLHRPPRPQQVAETAVVVGPPGQEIHTDEHGRVKVQFHWDLEGRHDERSSCWLRVAQAWAGARWGAQFVPRIGMEVVVTYLGGDLDRPLVTGCVYNATHPPPFAVPGDATRSGLRTQTVPAGLGANELSFEDAAGKEQVYLHAQRDYDEVIERRQTSRVGGGRDERIAGSTELHVGQDARTAVARDREAHVAHDERLIVGNRHEVEVGGDHRITVTGAMATKVLSGHALEVRGSHAVVVGTAGGKAVSDQLVYGSATISAEERLTLRAEAGISIVCGKARIDLLPDKIALSAPAIDLRCKDAITASAEDGPVVTIGDDVEVLSKKVRLFSEGAAIELDQDAKIKGTKVQLGYHPDKPSKDHHDAAPETKGVTIKLSDWFLRPYAGKTYHLLVEGLRFEGKTDAEGTLRERVPRSAEQAVLRLWIQDYPEGETRLYRIKLGELPPPRDVKGVEHRLKNLGYYPGPIGRGMGPELRAAIREFQHDHADTHGLEPSGDLDAATSGAIEEIFGS